MKSLIKSTVELRFEDIESVKAYQEELRANAEAEHYNVSTYNWTLKEVKSKGEVIDEYFIVKYTLIFNEAKAPENTLVKVKYELSL